MKRGLGRSKLESAASRHLRGTRKAFSALDAFDRLFKRAAEELDAPQAKPSREAAALLCSRIADDLRAFRLLASRGYVSQAMTIAASALEAIWTLSHIGHSNLLASEWFAHKNLQRSRWPVAVLRDAANPPRGKLLGLIYELFSAAKHHNPRLLPDLVAARSLEGHLLEVDPEYSPRAGRRITIFTSLVLYTALDGLTSLIDKQSLSDPWLDSCRRTVDRHRPIVHYAIAAMLEQKKEPPSSAG